VLQLLFQVDEGYGWYVTGLVSLLTRWKLGVQSFGHCLCICIYQATRASFKLNMTRYKYTQEVNDSWYIQSFQSFKKSKSPYRARASVRAEQLYWRVRASHRVQLVVASVNTVSARPT
jgi:hypothetical protein